jgi:hypothetical protein
MSSIIQSIAFNKFNWTIENALKWLKIHQHSPIKVDITSNYYRFRLKDPKQLKKMGFIHYSNHFINDNTMFLVIAYK